MTPTAQAQGGYIASGSGDAGRPKWNFLRFEEDWSVMKQIPKEQRTSLYDSLKYLPLNESGSVWMSVGGRMRFRVEGWDNFSFAEPNDDTFYLARFFIHNDLHLGEHLRIFSEGKSAHEWDRDLPGSPRTLDVDEFELQQAFIDLKFNIGNHKLTIRPGRRELLKGKQRLVSPLPWGNTLRHWDGISAIVDTHGWNVEGWWTQFAPVKFHDLNEPDAGNVFSGVYATGRIFDDKVGLDLFWLQFLKNSRTFNGTTGDENRHTVGGRIWGKLPIVHLDFEVEGAYQFGDINTADISAYMIASQFGYKRADWMWKPRIFLGFDYASGDDQSGGDVGTFNQLFPLGHAYLGFMDFVGRQNSVDFSHGISVWPIKKLMLTATGHKFWRAESNDAFYNAGGGVVRAGSAGTSNDIGYEVDLTAKYKFNRHLVGLFGYSHFFPGDFVEESGASDATDFIYLQGVFTF